MADAETVIEGLQDTEDAFEAAVISDYDAQTAVERELVLRLASCSGACAGPSRSRPTCSGSRGDRRSDYGPAGDRGFGSFLSQHLATDPHAHWDNARDAITPRTLTYCFLRLGNVDDGAFERLGRYKAALWRQAAQTLVLPRSIGRRYE
jgi:hypothetical protein